MYAEEQSITKRITIIWKISFFSIRILYWNAKYSNTHKRLAMYLQKVHNNNH